MRVRQSQLRRNLGRCFTGVLFLFGIRILWALSLRHHDVTVIEMKQPDGFPIVLYTIDANNSDFSATNDNESLDVKVKTDGRKTLVYVTEKQDNVDLLKEAAKEHEAFKPNVNNKVPSSVKDKKMTILDYFADIENKANIAKAKDNKHITPSNTMVLKKPYITNITRKEDLTFMKTEISSGVCSALPTWRQNNHAQMSTFDLLDTLVYTTNEAGEYPIPIRSIKQIEQYDNKTTMPLTVILVPFSHADPGYGLTLEEYYSTKTNHTLNLMIEKLFQYPNMTFQWAETVFLSRWFKDLNEVRQAKVKQLIDRGQLEIVSGGWVMPDEAQTTVASVVDQLIEGHQWLQEHLDVTPTSAWVNDPFGYSSTFPYLWKSAGMNNMLFLRINQPLKAKLMEMKDLEFLWRPYWSKGNSSDMLASLMPYTNYWVDDVCGPNQRICSKFNYLHLGEKNRNAVKVTDGNLKELATELYQQFKITGDLYKFNTLYMGLGEDFSYTKEKEWDDMFQNYQKLIDYINSQPQWNMKIKFGTLSEYFKKLRENQEKVTAIEKAKYKLSKEGEFSTLSGDFFPYTDKRKEFWTGYFTTRPLNKRFAREVESLLQAADTFNVIVHSIFKYYGVTYKPFMSIAGELRSARRELSVFMHHDGITGTSVPHVVRDFERRLVKSYLHTTTAMRKILVSLLSRGKMNEDKLLREEYVKPASRTLSEKKIYNTQKEVKLVLVNPLPRRRTEVVNLHVTSELFSVNTPKKSDIETQVQDTMVLNGMAYKTASFEVDLPAYGIEVYTLSPTKSPDQKGQDSSNTNQGENNALVLENAYMKIEFSRESGMMEKIIHSNGKVTTITTEFHSFYTTTGGAYIMDPESREVRFPLQQKYVTVTKGPLLSEVKILAAGFLHRVRIYNTTGIKGHGIHVTTELDMNALKMRNMDVIMIIRTDIENGPGFYTDQNNFQMIGRKSRKIISEAYYPVSTMVMIEDHYKRLNLHCKQPHGVSSLDGAIEVMLDRHTFRDDGRGLGQGVYDNVRVNSDFIFHVEHKKKPFQPIENRYTYPTEDAMLMNEMLQNPVFMYSQDKAVTKFLTKVHPLKTAEIPCDISVVKFRDIVKENLDYNSTCLVLHRHSFHCGFETQNNQCSSLDKPLTIKGIFPKLKVKLMETSLSMIYEKELLNLESDIRPNRNELRTLKIKL